MPGVPLAPSLRPCCSRQPRFCLSQYGVLVNNSVLQMENLLREDEPIVEKRKAARHALEDVKTAIFQVRSGGAWCVVAMLRDATLADVAYT
jgi:hypothetical protein